MKFHIFPANTEKKTGMVLLLYPTFDYSHEPVFKTGSVKPLCPLFAINITKVFHLFQLVDTRKYPLCGYFLGVLTHTTAWDRLWGGEQMFWFEILSALPCLVAV